MNRTLPRAMVFLDGARCGCPACRLANALEARVVPRRNPLALGVLVGAGIVLLTGLVAHALVGATR